MSQFLALTNIPILIFYGDNIPEQPTDMPAQDSWRARLQMARLWRGGQSAWRGRDCGAPSRSSASRQHPLPLLDLNNVQVADEVSKYLAEEDVD